MPKRKPNIGQKLIESLTSDQVAGLLTVFSSSTDFNVHMDKIEKIDPDTASTVKRVMDIDKGAQGRGKAKPLASAKRTMEYWCSLWRNWNEIVSQVGDEEGEYAVKGSSLRLTFC